jgi:hypothetical protein
MKIQAFTAEAEIFGKPREIDFDEEGTLRIFGLTMTQAQRIIRGLELGVVDIAVTDQCPSRSNPTT